MTVLKMEDIKKMNAKERKEKLRELHIALVQSRLHASQGKNKKTKEIKKAIARILTLKI